MNLPSINLVQQTFPRPVVENLAGAVSRELDELRLTRHIRPGQSVALGVGSRGIRHIDEIVRAVVAELKALGAEPFIVPAMGSHGGGTATGQRGVLTELGIRQETVGCPVRASMDVVTVADSSLGFPVVLDAHAAGADHIAVINRVKPHTKLSGAIESGLTKMCLIGLGKREGARNYHQAIDRHDWMTIVRETYGILEAQHPVLFGLAIVQNGYEDIAHVEGVPGARFLEAEPALLERARSLMGRLPLEQIHLLILDEIGKNISGTGLDTNVAGRRPGALAVVDYVFVRGLTRATHGNAQGIGLADFTTQRVVDEIDFAALYINSQTAHRTDTCKIPMTFPTDREALRVALDMSGVSDPRALRMIWAKNTLELEELAVSEACLPHLDAGTCLPVASPVAMELDGNGNLVSPFSPNP